ncbi:high density lipoprotein binding protein, isoform CRA_h [Rattus norvegicus]|uniref:High density lipoprotein binding protein, isoform CRA_h n=1 Tax=Rattus norvegicus TaxID=10116 RepID=A6JQZ0_RAT|nr:high density lipoprotein binding protein, isoform CRA_h [Rattus norvegicus]
MYPLEERFQDGKGTPTCSVGWQLEQVGEAGRGLLPLPAAGSSLICMRLGTPCFPPAPPAPSSSSLSSYNIQSLPSPEGKV